MTQLILRVFILVSILNNRGLGPVSRKSRKLFGPGRSFVKLRPAYSVKLAFSYVVKGIKIKITAKFRASSRLRFEDTNRIVSPEMRPKSFGTFEKRAPGGLLLKTKDIGLLSERGMPVADHIGLFS